MVLPARGPHHVPLAAGLLWDPVVDSTAEAATHLIIQVLCHIFGQVVGTLAPRDHGDHPGVRWCCLGRRAERGPRDHQVSWKGCGGVWGKSASREGQGGEATCASTVLEGTAGVEIVHGVVDGFVHCRRKILKKKNITAIGSTVLFLLKTPASQLTLMLFFICALRRAGGEWHPWQNLEVGVQRGRHHQALWWGHRCNRHLRHICGRYIQRLCFTSCPDSPHLPKNKQISKCFFYFLLQEPNYFNTADWSQGGKCYTKPTTYFFNMKSHFLIISHVFL